MPRSPGQGSLFERLELDRPPRRMRGRQELATERILAIKRQLEQILNARQGSAQSCPELGLRDLNDAAIGNADLRHQLCMDVRAAVAAYEPRVRVVEVRSLPAAGHVLDMRFRLHCLIPTNNDEEQVEIDLLFHHQDQRIRVS